MDIQHIWSIVINNVQLVVVSATVVFALLGTWGLIDQIRKIWFTYPRSAQSVSGEWSIIFLAIFAIPSLV